MTAALAQSASGRRAPTGLSGMTRSALPVLATVALRQGDLRAVEGTRSGCSGNGRFYGIGVRGGARRA